MVILGSTGSIGVNTLNIAKRFNLEVEALVAGNNIDLLNEQIDEFEPRLVVVANSSDVSRVNHGCVYSGEDGILRVIAESGSNVVVNALVGYLGLKPTLYAQDIGKSVALANKESLVVAGKFIDMSRITPIDSEHFALWYLKNKRPIEKFYITASGGAFRDWKIEDIANATYKDALKHPNWSMGSKITIDSASMVNKLFELLEARWLFGSSNIDAFIERKSLIHGLIEYKDGSTVAHFSGADMKLPIAYALNVEINEPIIKPLNLLEIGSLSFEKIDEARYPMWQIKEHLLNNPDMGVVLNAANEVAIERFKSGEFGFFKMVDLILKSYKKFDKTVVNSIEDIVAIDREVREFTKSLF